MRQSLSENSVAQPRLQYPRRAVTAMGVGLLLTMTTMIALIIDQTSVFSIADHVDALYAPFNLHPDPNVLFGLLYVNGVLGMLLWLALMWGARGNKRWARVMATIVLVVAASFALLVLFVSEYGTRIFPTAWGLSGLLPSIAGLVAVILLWNPRREAERSRDPLSPPAPTF